MIDTCPWPAPVSAVALAVGTVAAAGAAAGTGSGWWVIPEAGCAFLAGGRPGRARSTALALAAVVAVAVVAVALVPAWLVWASRFTGLVAAAMVPWCAGRFLRQYRELVRAGWERAAQLEREQDLLAEQARLRERTRIAQDMHDLLGHELSLLALSAGALQLAPGLPGEHRAAARDIRARAGAAVDRLGEVIGVLRDEPGPGPEELEDLVARAAGAGLDARLRLEGDAAPGQVPPVVERAVHRVVREALTNVAKHAPDHRATVVVRRTKARTEVRVTNAPPPDPAPGPGTGTGVARAAGAGSPAGDERRLGLVGLGERVRAAGGTFAAGPEGGGFGIRATLPHRLPAAAPEHRQARRRLGRSAAAAVLVPLFTVAALVTGVRVWDTVADRRSVFAPEDYARLRPGQPRAQIAPHLPQQQTARRPAAPVPRPPDAACEFYVQTADPFDDRSGDIYRLCFRAGLLVSADAIGPDTHSQEEEAR
ncbi:sensor histidine kinase [Streptomyces sp. NBC_00354]|uniref:sensor histidine kinase n=1 Tax=Streptomyces sp. NBC_00354 TaxID=2975723 RepID=UPI002E254C2F